MTAARGARMADVDAAARCRPSSRTATGPRAGGPTPPSASMVADGPRRHGRDRGSTCGPRCGRGPARSPTSTGPPARLAGALRGPGASGPATSSCSSCPNWVEAGIAFWAAAYLGAVVVPIVHFYGAKEVGYILDATEPDRRRHPRPLRATPTTSRCTTALLADRPGRAWLVVGDTPGRRAPRRRHRRSPTLLDGDPLDRPAGRRPRRAGPHRLHLRHDQQPEGRHPLAPHASASRPASSTTCSRRAGRPRSPARRSATSSACSTPSSCRCCASDPVNLVDVWDPGEVLRLMLAEGLGVGGGATYFLTSLLDHPDFTDEHLARMPFAGLGGSTVPVAVTERATRARHQGVPLLRQHRAPVDHRVACSTSRRRSASTPTATRCPAWRSGSTSDGEISSRGPDCFVGYTDPALTASVFDDDGLVPHRRRRRARRRRLPHHHRPGVRHHHPRAARTSAPRRSRSCSSASTASPRSRVVAAPDERLGERAAAVVRLREGAARPDPRRRARPPGRRRAWPSRSGRSRSTRSPTSRARRRARCRSSAPPAASGTASRLEMTFFS